MFPRYSDGQPGFRDAIHVPYILVTCETILTPGDKISLRDENTCVKWGTAPRHKWEGDEPMWHGVADPFREELILAGTAFRCMIRKECFSGLRHDFMIEVNDRGGTDTCHSVCDIF